MNIDDIKIMIDELDKKKLDDKSKRNLYALKRIRLAQLMNHKNDKIKLKEGIGKTLKWLGHIRKLVNETNFQA